MHPTYQWGVYTLTTLNVTHRFLLHWRAWRGGGAPVSSPGSRSRRRGEAGAGTGLAARRPSAPDEDRSAVAATGEASAGDDEEEAAAVIYEAIVRDVVPGARAEVAGAVGGVAEKGAAVSAAAACDGVDSATGEKGAAEQEAEVAREAAEGNGPPVEVSGVPGSAAVAGGCGAPGVVRAATSAAGGGRREKRAGGDEDGWAVAATGSVRAACVGIAPIIAVRVGVAAV